MSIADNVLQVKKNIEAAALACGRNPGDIILVGATKMNDAARVREAIAAGLEYCGENRVQELVEKNGQGAYEGSHLHFIGHLQKNKVKFLVGTVELIHSVHSVELAAEINKRAAALGIVQDILLEVNIGGEEAKSGFAPEELKNALKEIAHMSSIRVCGLMAIPPVCSNSEENRHYFSQMRQLYIDIEKDKKYNNVIMGILSMGMSADYEVAISEGANMVRVGTGIFGARDYGAAAGNADAR
ncbi:MAG: YggS family pyridoxal phosphate-dependent enzyme [Bacillota bacterium]|nr:YggS family pyridoxal phosphate-dependent enzyme [Bacillota bacterium]